MTQSGLPSVAPTCCFSIFLLIIVCPGSIWLPLKGVAALRHLFQGQGLVEDLARVDLSVQDQVDQLGQVAAHRDWLDGMRAPDGLHPGFRKAKVLYLALLD